MCALPLERFKNSYVNWRWNPFTSADMAVDAEEDGLIIPAGSPFIIQLLEVPRYNDPSTVAVRCYGVDTFVDDESLLGQKVLKVDDTAGFSPGDNVIINRGGAREEEKIIDTIQAGISLTMTVNLEYTHTAVQADVAEKFIAFTETAGAPAQSQFRVDYPPAEGEGTGLVEFNTNDANKEVRVSYKATGSPALAETLDTKISYPAGTPGDDQFLGFDTGVPIWRDFAHINLTGIGVNDHHAQSHSLASHSTKAHTELTGVSANQHHAQSHTLVSHTSRDHHHLVGLGDDDHAQYYNAGRHTKVVHDALRISELAAIINLENVAITRLQGGTSLHLEASSSIRSARIAANTTTEAANMYITDVGFMYRKTSSERFKENIADLEVDSSLLYNLRPVSFKSKGRDDDKKRRFIGLIAEEVHQVIPEIVKFNKDNIIEDYDLGMLTIIMLKEIQRLKEEIEIFKAR